MDGGQVQGHQRVEHHVEADALGGDQRPPAGDLTDLISRKHSERATVTVKPDDTLLTAYGRMKLYDISQLPVLNGEGAIAGIIDEEDLLFAVVRNRDKFKDPVKSAMTYRVETLDASAKMEALLPVFESELGSIGRAREDVPILVSIEVDDLGGDLGATVAHWQARGAAEVIVHDVKAIELDGVLSLRPDRSTTGAADPR